MIKFLILLGLTILSLALKGYYDEKNKGIIAYRFEVASAIFCILLIIYSLTYFIFLNYDQSNHIKIND